MFNLNFIQELEDGKNSLMKNRDLYVQLKNKILEAQREGMAIAERGEKLTDENSKEYKELVEKANKIKERINSLGKDLKVVQKRFENIKQYIIKSLIKNKEIIEKYKDIEDDKDLNDFRDKLKDVDINKEKLDDKINKISEQINLNSLSKEEISKMNQEKRKEVLNAKEQYLNNKKELEKLEKIKYITLLGNEEPKKRIFQYESAIAYIDKQFSIENIEGVIEKLEETLGIQKQKVQVKFDLKTHTYTFVDERGKETVFENLFSKDEDGKYKGTLTDENIKTTKQWAKTNGLTKRQIKSIDYNVVKVIQTVRPDLLNSYLEAIKEGKEADFDIEYNFKTKGTNKDEKIDRKELRKIKILAYRQKMKGIATVIKGKTKLKIAGIMAAIGLTGFASAIAGNESNLALNQGITVDPIVGEMLNQNSKISDSHDTKDDVSQCAKIYDVENAEIRTDKFGNPIDKTEEQKIADEAMKNYYKRKENVKQNSNVNNQENQQNQQNQQVMQNKSKEDHLEKDVINFEELQEDENSDKRKSEIDEPIQRDDEKEYDVLQEEVDDKSPQSIEDYRIPDDGVLEEDCIERINDESNIEVNIIEKYEGDVISEDEFKKQYIHDVEKQYYNNINNKNVIIDVEDEIYDEDER